MFPSVTELYYLQQGRVDYSLSILIASDSSIPTLELKRLLEKNGCQVDWINLDAEDLAAYSRKYFDLIIFILERLDDHRLEQYRTIKAYPELAHMPVVLLTRCPQDKEAISRSRVSPMYCIPEDDRAERKLLQIIDEVNYMTQRYA